MSNRKQDEVYYIDKDIEHLLQKRKRLTREAITKDELKSLAKDWKDIHLSVDHKPKLSRGTIKQYAGHVKQFIDYLPTDTSITRKEVLSWGDDVLKKYKASTAENKYVAISKFLVYCGLYDLRLQKVKAQSKTSIDNIITDDQFRRLLSACKKLVKTDNNKSHEWEEMYLVLRTIGMCGIRIEERQFVTYENLNKGSIVYIFFKGKQKPIFINEKVRKELLEYAEKHELYEGGIFKLTYNQVIYRIKKIVREAKIKKGKFNPHAFRHYFAIKFMEQVGDIQILKQVLGHADIATTAIYLKQTNANVRDLVNTMDFSDSPVVVAKTETGKLVSDYEESVYAHRGQWTKKAAVELLIDLLNKEQYE